MRNSKVCVALRQAVSRHPAIDSWCKHYVLACLSVVRRSSAQSWQNMSATCCGSNWRPKNGRSAYRIGGRGVWTSATTISKNLVLPLVVLGVRIGKRSWGSRTLVDEETIQSRNGTRPNRTEYTFRRHNETCQYRIEAELQKTDWGRKRVERHQDRLQKYARKMCTLSAPQMGIETEGTSVHNAIMSEIPNVDSDIMDKLAPKLEYAVEEPLQKEQGTKCDNTRGTSALSTSSRCQNVTSRQLQPVDGTAGNWCEVFGFTWGCQACECIAEAGSTRASHSIVCKARMELLSSQLLSARGVQVQPSTPQVQPSTPIS